MENINVLLTAVGAPFMPGLIRCLKRNGERNITVVGVDIKDDNTIVQYCDKFEVVPKASDSNYIETLLSICKKYRIDVFIPCMSQELLSVHANINKFSKIGTKVSISTGDGLFIANDKILLYQYMAECGFELPKFAIAKSLEEFESACSFIGFPDCGICVKIKNGSGSRGIRIIDPKKSRYEIFVNEKPNSFYTTYEDMLSILGESEVFPELLIMEFLPGEEYSVDLLADHGKVLYIVGRESNVINASIPMEATLVYNKKAYEISRQIVESLKLDGNVDLDFKFDYQGNPILMEINPRIAATLSVIAEGGCNLLYFRIKQLLEESLPNVEIRYGLRLKRRYEDMFSDISI